MEARLQTAGRTGQIARRGQVVHLEEHEVALLEVLAAAHEAQAAKPPESRGFLRSIELAAALREVIGEPSDLATALVRRMARRLERRLEALGGPPVLEVCERRGYRVTGSLANGVEAP